MPQTLAKSSSVLGIRLDGDSQTIFAPGDTILGCIFRRDQTVSPDGLLTICLNGRAKSLILVSVLNNTAERFRGRFNLLDTGTNTHKVFQGPIHIPQSGQEQVWPFSIKIPTNVDRTAADQTSQILSRLPSDSGAITSGPLPSSFEVETHGNRSSTIGFVEYFLRAELRLSGQGSVDVSEALFPVTIHNLHPHPSIVDFKLQPAISAHSISSFRLLPGNEHSAPSFSQRTKKLFGSSKIPGLFFNAQVDFPSVIQIDNPKPIPFTVRLTPDSTKCTENLRGSTQKFKLTRITMKIVAKTQMFGEGVTRSHEADTTQELDLDPMVLFDGLQEPIFISCSEKSPAVDVGEILNLRIGRQGRPGQKSPGTLYPSFRTYNIVHTHSMVWGFGLEIAGKNILIHASKPLVILPPSTDKTATSSAPAYSPATGASKDAPPQQTSESWIRPPDDGQAPPSFDQVREEDLAVTQLGDAKDKKRSE
ncbi:hypothetical protein B0J13DRAFT_559585 [Dactylonectria estremocensis]|uniref:Arrestin-like N-terminal domain-containing protein n=1 Tax=Dactylonectria estremocensis TaxID=1079267 RepID=A0A9P9IVS4_9HYPO|nr:hypothetical protein B0J13DRAFT_559585 [Dactylonectria estremocensis]